LHQNLPSKIVDVEALIPPVESNLSLRAMFLENASKSSDVQHTSSTFGVYEYDETNDEHPINDTPPQSLTPNSLQSKKQFGADGSYPVPTVPTSLHNASASTLVSLASSATSEASVAGEEGGRNRQPSIYSAIGSLEDPLSSSFKGWKGISNRGKGARNNHHFDFPSSTLLVPKSQVLAKKKRNAPGTKILSHSHHQSGRDVSQPLDPQHTLSRTKEIPGVIKAASFDSDDRKIAAEPNQKCDKKVTIKQNDIAKTKGRKSSRKQNAYPVEMFRPSSDAYTPRMGKKEIKYKPAEMRTSVQQMASPLGTLSRPDFRDALRRVAMIIHQHIVKIERRFEHQKTATAYNRRRKDDGLFSRSMKDEFSEDRFLIPRYKCTMVRVPMAHAGMVYGLKQIREVHEIPSETEIYEFAHQLFKSVQLSSECSIVGLIYVERLMETAKVPLLADTWRPIFMCGLLMASKVWQDLSSWNIEFASVYPQYSLESINRLELLFLRMVKWDLYISSSQYAKYYFALRSLVEKTDFRRRYNRMVGGVDMVQASQARKIEERSTMVKEEFISHLSRSM
jgi:Cyclin